MDKTSNDATTKKKKNLSDDALDGIAAVVLITIIVVGIGLWLNYMP